MLKRGAWLIYPLLFLPLAGQDAPILPDLEAVPPPLDMISPVPLPEIAFGQLGAEAPMMPENLNISNPGGGTITFVRDTEIRFGGLPGVKVVGDNGLEIFSDYAVVDLKAESVTLEGNVRVYQGNALQRGDRVVYFYERNFVDASGLRASLDPILLEAGKFRVEERDGSRVYVGEDAGITTHDVENPNFWVRSDQTTIYPGDRVVFDNLRLYVHDTPVFWLPYLSQPLDGELGYHFIPGGRSNWGAFLLNTYGIMLGGKRNPETGENEDAWLLSRWHLDFRARRGVGTGVDFRDTRAEKSDEFSGLSFYYLNDLAPDTRRSGVPRGFVNEDRYRIELKHRHELKLPEPGEWRFDSNLTLLSDMHYLEDFEPSRYRNDPAPDNTLGIFRRDEDSLLSVFARLRLNDFYRADTRLPEISFDQARSPRFGLPLLHEGKTSFGILGERASDQTRDAVIKPLMGLTANDSQTRSLLRQLSGHELELAQRLVSLPLNDPEREAIRTQLLDPGYARFHTYQEVSLPLTYGGFLNIVPQGGAGYTRYDAVNGPLPEIDRSIIHGGVEASVKFSKNLGAYQNPAWGLDGLKHILQPYSFWSVVATDDFDLLDPQIDRLAPTTRPRPLDPARFIAVDELNSWNVLRLGARNRLLTQRDGQSFEWLHFDTYFDAFIDDPEGQRDFSNLYNDIRWQPLPWMGLDFNTQFPIVSGGSGFSELDSRLRVMPTQNTEFSFGYRMLNGHPVFVDSNRFDIQSYVRMNENWGFGTRHVLELDDGTLESARYSFHRDLGNWVAGIGFSRRDNRQRQEYGVVLSLTLKDFPSVSLPFGIDAE
jgi:LPS-assembly protein